MPEGRLYRSMLLDFYSPLLTARQRECYDLHYNEDLSLSEIAEQCGISRQGAWDNIRRAGEAMENFEAKSGLIRRFLDTEVSLRRLLELMEELHARVSDDQETCKLTERALEEIHILLNNAE